MPDFNPPFLPGKVFHVFNRGNNRENLFYKADNYRYFLDKYYKYLTDWVDTYVYSFMPNHFHLMIRVKEAADRKFQSIIKGGKIILDTGEIVSEMFRRFFTTYAKAINEQEDRVGSLFQKKMKRIEVTTPEYFTKLIYYIHANPQRHGIINDFKNYKYSSFNELISERKTNLMREELFNWFGGKEEYIRFHLEEQKLDSIKKLMIE